MPHGARVPSALGNPVVSSSQSSSSPASPGTGTPRPCISHLQWPLTQGGSWEPLSHPLPSPAYTERKHSHSTWGPSSQGNLGLPPPMDLELLLLFFSQTKEG